MPYKPDVYHRLQKIHIQIKIEKKKIYSVQWFNKHPNLKKIELLDTLSFRGIVFFSSRGYFLWRGWEMLWHHCDACLNVLDRIKGQWYFLSL